MPNLLQRAIPCLALLAVLFNTVIAKAETVPFRTERIKTADGLTISVQEWGNPQGQAIVLIHGLLQSHLSWIKQTGGALAKQYHLITYDLRGHGESDAPTEAKYYQNGAAWAQELDAVLQATHATRPILVGWSMGGVVISDYLQKYGTARLGGLVYLDSWVKAPLGANRSVQEQMASPDLAKRIAARTAFLRACFYTQPTSEEFAAQLAFNMLTPPQALIAMVTRPLDYEAVAKTARIPVLVYHGEHDVLMPASIAKHTVETFPTAKLVIVPGTGHAPFYEKPEPFNQVLADFVSGITRK